jgi:flagellar protein FliO/FliZ
MDAFLTGIRVLLSLAVVFALLWYLARRMRKGHGGARRSVPVQVLGKAPLGGKAQVVVVEAAGRRMVLGVTEAGVSMLHDEEAPPLTRAEVQAQQDAAAKASAPAFNLPLDLSRFTPARLK